MKTKILVIVNGTPVEIESYPHTQLKHICGHAIFQSNYDHVAADWELKDETGRILHEDATVNNANLPDGRLWIVMPAGVGA